MIVGLLEPICLFKVRTQVKTLLSWNQVPLYILRSRKLMFVVDSSAVKSRFA